MQSKAAQRARFYTVAVASGLGRPVTRYGQKDRDPEALRSTVAQAREEWAHVYVMFESEAKRRPLARTPERRIEAAREAGIHDDALPLALPQPRGRPPDPDARTELLPGVRVRPETAERLRAWAKARDVSLSALLAEEIEEALRRADR